VLISNVLTIIGKLLDKLGGPEEVERRDEQNKVSVKIVYSPRFFRFEAC
jgi:hypothetical protein